jgi:hypothetical protein
MFVVPALVWLSWNSWVLQRRKRERDPSTDPEEAPGWHWSISSTFEEDVPAKLQAPSPGSILGSEILSPGLQVRS